MSNYRRAWDILKTMPPNLICYVLMRFAVSEVGLLIIALGDLVREFGRRVYCLGMFGTWG